MKDMPYASPKGKLRRPCEVEGLFRPINQNDQFIKLQLFGKNGYSISVLVNKSKAEVKIKRNGEAVKTLTNSYHARIKG